MTAQEIQFKKQECLNRLEKAHQMWIKAGEPNFQESKSLPFSCMLINHLLDLYNIYSRKIPTN